MRLRAVSVGRVVAFAVVLGAVLASATTAPASRPASREVDGVDAYDPLGHPFCAGGGRSDLSDAEGTLKSFESGGFEGWLQEFAGPHSGQVVDGPVRCGDRAARFELREGDMAGPVGGHRSELHELLDYRAPEGSETWYGFSTYVPEDWPALDDRAVITQWHATPDFADGEVWRSPPLAVRYSGSGLSVTGRHSSVPIQLANDGAVLELYEHPGTFERGVWHDWVFHVRWDHSDRGFVRAWLDRAPVIDYQGPIGYNDENGVWFKWGIYRGRDDHPESVVIYHDEYRRSSDCAFVAPELCGTSPPDETSPEQDPTEPLVAPTTPVPSAPPVPLGASSTPVAASSAAVVVAAPSLAG